MPNQTKSPNVDSFFFANDITNEEAIKVISEYVDMNYPEISEGVIDQDFEVHSISRWVCYEILNRLMDNSSQTSFDGADDPIGTITFFICEMEVGEMYAVVERPKEVYEIAAGVGEELIALFT